MLYHFPDESPAQLLEKEKRLLARQIRNAKRVETRGFRKAEMTLPSSYIEWRCIHEYLRCPITKWKWPTNSKDMVELEALPTDFLPPLKPHRPLSYYDPELKAKVHRIVGYRELLRKREHVEYLRDVDDAAAVEVNYNIQMEEETTEQITEASFGLSWLYRRLRGGGGGGKPKPTGNRQHAKPRRGRQNRQGGRDKKTGKTDTDTKPMEPEKKGVSEVLRAAVHQVADDIANYFHINENIFKEKEKKELALKKAAKEEKRKMEAEQMRNIQEIYQYHEKFKVPEIRERDSEWLELSLTDQEEEKLKVTTLEKLKLPGMDEDISFESQYLVKTLEPYTWTLTLTGRSFMNVKPDYEKKHMDFTHRRRDVLLFFFTSIMFWVGFCLMTVSFMLISWENQGSTKSKDLDALGANETDAADLDTYAANARHEVEELELEKYHIPAFVVLINLSLVAIWSILIILGDGILVSHYMNCWCAALSEMETSGCVGIRREIYSSLMFVVFYALATSIMFYVNYPVHIRFCSGLITAFIVRPVYPDLRINTDSYLLPFQIAGLVFQIYVVFCSTMIKLLMKIFAIILKNASEMWNLKFALTFEQLATRTRGQLFKMSLNHSLVKLFTDHRILTVLLRNFGEVFVIPIMIYMICEMGVITLTMVRLFFYKAGTKEQYDGDEAVLIESAWINKTDADGNNVTTTNYEPIKIPYYHTTAEVYLTHGLMIAQLIFQFLDTTEVLASAGVSASNLSGDVEQSFAGAPTSGVWQIQSLEWSFSSTNPSVLSANSYFPINRSTILAAFATVVGFFSLIIQLQVQAETNVIKFLTTAHCDKVTDLILEKGTCISRNVAKERDPSSEFIGSIVDVDPANIGNASSGWNHTFHETPLVVVTMPPPPETTLSMGCDQTSSPTEDSSKSERQAASNCGETKPDG